MTESFSQSNLVLPKLAYTKESEGKLAELHSNGGRLTFAFVWLFGFALFCRPEDMYEPIGKLHLTLFFGIFASVSCLRSVILGRSRIIWSRELKLVLLLTVWFALGIPFAFYRRASFELLTGEWLRTLLFFFVLTQTLTSLSRIRKIIWVLLLSAGLASSLSLLMQGNPLVMVGDRLAGINKGLLGWNFLGITMSVTIPFMAYLYVTRKSLLRSGLLLVVLGSSLWMVVLTASRGGVIGLVLSLVLTYWFILRESGRGRLTVALGIFCLLIASAKAPPVFWQRLGTVWSSSSDKAKEETTSAEESTAGRLYLLQESIVVTFEHPVVGVGIGNFPYYTGATIREVSGFSWLSTHNIYTQISSEAGIPAFVLLLMFFSTMIRHAYMASRVSAATENREAYYLARASLASVLIFSFQGFFAHLGYACLLYYLAAIIAGGYRISQELNRVDDAKREVLEDRVLSKEVPHVAHI